MVEQSNPGGSPWMSIILCFCCACAEFALIPENVPKPASARRTPVTLANRPIKTRRLKNPPSQRLRRAGADREVAFLFIVWSLSQLVLSPARSKAYQREVIPGG